MLSSEYGTCKTDSKGTFDHLEVLLEVHAPALLAPLLLPAFGFRVADEEWGQIVIFRCLDVSQKSPDVGERQYKSGSWKGRFYPPLRAGGQVRDGKGSKGDLTFGRRRLVIE